MSLQTNLNELVQLLGTINDPKVYEHVTKACRRTLELIIEDNHPQPNAEQSVRNSHNLSKFVIAELEQENKLEAVKLHRAETGLTLMQSKHAIEDYMADRWGIMSFNQ